MKIGDRIYVHGYVDEIRKECVIVRNDGGYFGTVKSEIVEAQKAEDIVSVVRCKDCLHWDGDSCHVEVWNSEDADSVILDRHADDYCSRAEEKENDN